MFFLADILHDGGASEYGSWSLAGPITNTLIGAVYPPTLILGGMDRHLHAGAKMRYAPP